MGDWEILVHFLWRWTDHDDDFDEDSQGETQIALYGGAVGGMA